ncbi:hypothetical protein BDC45DRAFT_542386 [Circinella umbellata]|nr:hypothetical protein BDC45DRAFT_542386 [Circinella umbellata]
MNPLISNSVNLMKSMYSLAVMLYLFIQVIIGSKRLNLICDGSLWGVAEFTFNRNLVKQSSWVSMPYNLWGKKDYGINYLLGEIKLLSMTEKLSLQGMTGHHFRYNEDGKILIKQ